MASTDKFKTTGDELIDYCDEDDLPRPNSQVWHDFYFSRCRNQAEVINLLGVYQGLSMMHVRGYELNNWRNEGSLMTNITKHFEAYGPPGGRGDYYPWLLRNQQILDGSQSKETGKSNMEESIEQDVAEDGSGKDEANVKSKKKGGLRSVDILWSDVAAGTIPTNPRVLTDFGFDGQTTADQLELVTLYDGLRVMSRTKKDLEEWRVSGQLVEGINGAYWKMYAKLPKSAFSKDHIGAFFFRTEILLGELDRKIRAELGIDNTDRTDVSSSAKSTPPGTIANLPVQNNGNKGSNLTSTELAELEFLEREQSRRIEAERTNCAAQGQDFEAVKRKMQKASATGGAKSPYGDEPNHVKGFFIGSTQEIQRILTLKCKKAGVEWAPLVVVKRRRVGTDEV